MVAVVNRRARFTLKAIDDKRRGIGVPRTARLVLMRVKRWPCRLDVSVSVLFFSNRLLLD
jgi:hypothetical protein